MKKIPFGLWAWIIGVSVFVLSICAVRYNQFQYEGLDLGIYHQVLWNTARGRLFQFSFNEASYLVDHREWLLVLFVPLYWIVNHPFVLLIIQTVLVNSVAIPMYLLIRRVIPQQPRVAFFGAVLTMLYPTILNMQFFEFHMLVFVVPLTVWWWYGIVTYSWWRWLLFIALLLLREDIPITTAAAGIVIWLHERTRWKEALVIVGASAVWFMAMVWVGSYLSIEDAPLFFSLYAWMGNSPVAALQFMLLHPLQVLVHIFSLNNFFLLFLFFMTTAFLPLLALRYMIPVIVGLMVYFLMDAIDIGMAIFVYHYGAPMAVWSCIAAIYGYARLQDVQRPIRVPIFTHHDIQELSGPVIVMVLSATMVFFGPQWILLDTWTARHEETEGMRTAVAAIPVDAAVLTSDRTYPHLSSRQRLYSAKYTQTGLKHYSDIPYVFQPFDWALLTDETPRVWNIHSTEEKRTAAQRLREQIEKNDLLPVQLFEQGVLYGPRSAGLPEQAPVRDGVPAGFDITMVNQRVHPTVTIKGYTYDQSAGQFQLQLQRESDETAQQFLKDHVNEQDVFVRVEWRTSNGFQAHTQYRLLGSLTDPLYTWEPGIVRTMILPWQRPANAHSVELHFGTLTMPRQFFFVTQSVPLEFQTIPAEYTTVHSVLRID